MKKIYSLYFILTIVLLLVSCVTTNEVTYTVTWQSDLGEVLEIDENVKKGTLPTYDGDVPVKPSYGEFKYVFTGWNPEITEVTKDVTYQAVFEKVSIEDKTYTITWQNEAGEILEIDENVSKGSTPSYDGKTPTKESTTDFAYEFIGWTPEITLVEKDTIYIATFKEIYLGIEIQGMTPILSEDKKTVLYGLYPQTYVNDLELTEILNNLETSNINGWYLYENEYYVKSQATTYNNETYTFNDGTNIINDQEYWFKCEPIKWNVLNSSNGNYKLMSSLLLDTTKYYDNYDNRVIENQIIYANNYDYSNIRKWLLNDFYQQAFGLNNQYLQNETNDLIYLPSYVDLINSEFGFDQDSSIKSNTRVAFTTDYARAQGIWCNTKKDLGSSTLYSGTYWTKTAGEYNYTAWIVNSGGYISNYTIDGMGHGVRPCIEIYINE